MLIRIHGDIVDKKQRFYEAIIFTLLSERGIGPKTYGIFYSGRIEEFIPVSFFFVESILVINGLRKLENLVTVSLNIINVFEIHCTKNEEILNGKLHFLCSDSLNNILHIKVNL